MRKTASKYGYMATIGADTSGLTAAMHEIDNNAKNISRELKAVNEGLKLDDSNTEGLKSKMDLLSQTIEATKDKLEKLKSAQNDMDRALSNGKITSTQYAAYQRDIANTSSALRVYEQELRNTQTQLKNVEDSTANAKKETQNFDDSVENAGQKVVSFGDILKANLLSDAIASGVRKLTSEFVDFAKESIEVASDLTEVQNVIDVTFGSNAEEINAWAQNAKTAYGMSELMAKQFAGTMGAMLKSSGVAEESVTELSESIVGLAGDMASFYNLDYEAAFAKIRSGISGETEPLKQLGINMSVANMEAFALAEGIEKPWKKMSQAEQTMLRYQYLIAQTADAQGDFARTSDSMANQQKILELNLTEAKATLGNELIPIMNNIVSIVNSEAPNISEIIVDVGTAVAKVTEFLLENKDAVLTCSAGFATFYGVMQAGKTIDTVVTSLKTLKTATEAATTAQYAMNAAAAINPYVLLASAIAAVTMAIGVYMLTAEGCSETLKDAAEKNIEEYESQKNKVKELEEALGDVQNKIKELHDKGKLTIAEEQDLINLQLQNDELSAQLAIEQELLEVKKKLASDSNYDAIMSDDRSSSGTIANVNFALESYQYAVDQLQYWQDELDQAIKNGDQETIDYMQDNVDQFTNEMLTQKANALTALQSVNELAEGIDETTVKGQEAAAAVADLNQQILELFNLDPEGTSESDLPYSGETQLDKAGERYRVEGEAAYTAAEEEKKLREDTLKSDTAAFDEKLKLHKISEEQYYNDLEKYLNLHVDKNSETWWKYYEKVESYRDKQAENEKKAEEERQKQLEEDKKAEQDIIKGYWDEVTRQHDRGEIDDETEYRLKAQIVKKYCDENEKEWDSYYTWLYKYQKNKNDQIAKNEKEAWENNVKNLSDTLTESYENLVKQKEKVKEDLANIDLTETVTDVNGKDVTVLADLDAEYKKLDTYQKSLDRLKATGISDALLADIMSMDYADGSRQKMIDTILGLSAENRQRYYNDYAKVIAKQDEIAQASIHDGLDDLNEQTANAVDDIFGTMPESAYAEGAATAQSFIQGIIDAMGGTVDNQAAMSLFNLGAAAPSATSNKASGNETVAANTPITIILNDKEYINTTIGEMVNNSRLSGGNTFNL